MPRRAVSDAGRDLIATLHGIVDLPWFIGIPYDLHLHTFFAEKKFIDGARSRRNDY
jgi:hypothetical protein